MKKLVTPGSVFFAAPAQVLPAALIASTFTGDIVAVSKPGVTGAAYSGSRPYEFGFSRQAH
ncbi:MAG: hypothetical protein M3463_01150 [Verrucomicrobiota bacterium]|nr:hypothetical protein [Verrucomicrobiota bacterium]